MVADESLIFEMELLCRGGFAFVRVREIAQGVEVVLWFEQLFALDAEDFGDAERLKGDAGIEAQKVVEFVGRKEIPIGDLDRR